MVARVAGGRDYSQKSAVETSNENEKLTNFSTADRVDHAWLEKGWQCRGKWTQLRLKIVTGLQVARKVTSKLNLLLFHCILMRTVTFGDIAYVAITLHILVNFSAMKARGVCYWILCRGCSETGTRNVDICRYLSATEKLYRDGDFPYFPWR